MLPVIRRCRPRLVSNFLSCPHHKPGPQEHLAYHGGHGAPHERAVAAQLRDCLRLRFSERSECLTHASSELCVAVWRRCARRFGCCGRILLRYGGVLDVNKTSQVPVTLSGRGDLVGSYRNPGRLFVGTYLDVMRVSNAPMRNALDHLGQSTRRCL